MRGDGYDVRLDLEADGVSTGLTEAADGGRDGKSCERRSEPDVFFRLRGSREKPGAPPATVGEPARRALGTLSAEDFVVVVAGEPARSGDGTPSMAVGVAVLELNVDAGTMQERDSRCLRSTDQDSRTHESTETSWGPNRRLSLIVLQVRQRPGKRNGVIAVMQVQGDRPAGAGRALGAQSCWRSARRMG
jgi:hypothetical protein